MAGLDEKAREYAGLFEQKLGVTVPIVERSFLWFLCIALAAMYVSVEKLAIRATRDNLISTGSPDGVVNQGREFLGREPYQATPAVVKLVPSGAWNPGAVVPAGTSFSIEETGLVYQSLTSAIGGLGVFEVMAQCTSSGVAGNFVGTGSATMQTVLAGVPVTWIATMDTTGIDGETIEEYGVKALDAKRYIGGGGNLWDYRIWGQEVPGVRRVYPYRGRWTDLGGSVGGLSSRTCFVQCSETINADGIAPLQMCEDVKTAILVNPSDSTERTPASSPNSTFEVKPIRRILFNVEVYGTQLSWDPNAGQAITDAVRNYLFNLIPYIQGVDPVAGRTNEITTVNLSGVVRDASFQYGVNPTEVKLFLASGGVEIQAYTLPAGGLAKLGTIQLL